MAQGDEPEFYRELPDRPFAPPTEAGIHSSPIGSFMPVGTYRPIPIVRFAGTVVMQILALLALFTVLYSKAGVFTIATTALVSLALGKRAWGRDAAEMPTGWKTATIGVLALNWGLVALGSAGR